MTHFNQTDLEPTAEAPLLTKADSHPALRELLSGPVDTPDILRQLLLRNAQPDAIDLRTAIHHKHPAMTEELLAIGVDLNLISDGGPTPLMEACRVGPLILVWKLLDRGALLNTQDSAGNTALHAALFSEVEPRGKLRALLERGADLRRPNHHNQTPSDLARAHGHLQLALWLDELALHSGPQWMRDARARHINLIPITTTKTEGLTFNPHDIDFPILYGGDYDGARPMTAARALWQLQADLSAHRLQSARPFLPFLEKLARGEDFSLAELMKIVAVVRY